MVMVEGYNLHMYLCIKQMMLIRMSDQHDGVLGHRVALVITLSLPPIVLPVTLTEGGEVTIRL